MKHHLYIRWCLVLLMTGLLLQGCRQGNGGKGYKFSETAFDGTNIAPSSTENPLVLKLAINETYCKKTACKCIQHLASREYDEVLNVLKEKYNIDLHLTYCMEEDSLQELIKGGTFDGFICKPWFALELAPSRKYNFTRVADIPDPFDNGLLSGNLIVRKDSPIVKPEDISGKILALGFENSYEKYHLPMAFLKNKGISPAKIIQKGGCTECINLLLDGKADAAVISDYALIASCATDFVSEDAFRTIYTTPDIPLVSVLIDLDKVKKEDAARLQKALLEMSAGGVPESFTGKGFVRPVSWIPAPFQN